MASLSATTVLEPISHNSRITDVESELTQSELNNTFSELSRFANKNDYRVVITRESKKQIFTSIAEKSGTEITQIQAGLTKHQEKLKQY